MMTTSEKWDLHVSAIDTTFTLTFGAKHLFTGPWQGNSVITFLAVAHRVVLDLGARRVLVLVDAREPVEALLPQFLGCGQTFRSKGEKRDFG